MSRILEAIEYVINEVEAPALNHPELEKEYKNKVIRSRTIVRNMKRVGDLKKYLQRFETIPVPGSLGRPLYDRFKALGLETYEDLYPRFYSRFKSEFEDVTVLDDFVIGQNYTSWDISILSQTYDTQSGIYLIGDDDRLQAIFIKATLANGKYPNEWIVENEQLKYYFYSLNGVFKPEYKYNNAILKSLETETPIYLFIKNDTVLNLNGIFQFGGDDYNPADESRWFILNKVSSLDTPNPMTTKEYTKEIDKQVRKASRGDERVRRERLGVAPRKPESVPIVTTAFKRNPDVIVEVLARANGLCELCGVPAPFLRASDLSPYLEVHHKIPLADGGDDTVENAIAVCPNCHREEHFGVPAKVVTAALIVHEGKVLIAKRGESMKHQGMWEFPGGKLEPGETLEECVKREIKEELDIEIEVLQYFGQNLYTYSNGAIRLMAYWSAWKSGVVDLKEHERFEWADLHELVNYNFLPADQPLVENLAKLGQLFK